MLNLLTPAHIAALSKIIGGFPVGDFMAILSGTATLDSDIDLAEKLAALVATAFPPAAISVGEIELALEALRFLLNTAQAGDVPLHITGGQPDIIGEETAQNFRDR